MLFGACSFAGHSMLLKDVIREADWCVCIRTSYAKKKKKIVPLRQAISQSRRASPFYCPESLFFFPKRVFTRWRWQNSCRDAAFETNYAKSVTKMIHAMRTRQQPWPAWAPAVHVPWTEGWMDGWKWCVRCPFAMQKWLWRLFSLHYVPPPIRSGKAPPWLASLQTPRERRPAASLLASHHAFSHPPCL